jgi:hypothetical protein
MPFNNFNNNIDNNIININNNNVDNINNNIISIKIETYNYQLTINENIAHELAIYCQGISM